MLKEILRTMKRRFPKQTVWTKIPRIYLTLKCNLRCPYCSNGRAYDYSEMGFRLLSGAQWVEKINNLPGNTVIFSGGEPCIHSDLALIVNNINKWHIYIYTNLNYNFDKFLRNLKKQIYFYISFHPNNKSIKIEKVIENLAKLKESGKYKDISVHLIAHHSNAPFGHYVMKFAEHGYNLKVDRDQYETNLISNNACNFEKKSKVKCMYDRFYLAPDGKRYICVSKLVRRKPEGIVDFKKELPEMICDEYGYCSPCDEVANIKPFG